MSFLVLPAISICANMTLANVWKHHSFETTSLRILPGFSLLEPCPGYTVRCLFVIRNISLSLFLCVSTNPWLYVQRQSGARKNLLIAEGSVMIAADFSSSEILRKKKAQCAPVCVCVWVCVVWGFCRVGHTRVPRWCWMCVIVTQLRDMGSCGEICPQPSSCLSICWNVVAECCGWLLLPTVFYLQPILPSLFTEWPRHTGVANATEKGGWLVTSVQLSAVALNLI